MNAFKSTRRGKPHIQSYPTSPHLRPVVRRWDLTLAAYASRSAGMGPAPTGLFLQISRSYLIMVLWKSKAGDPA